MLSGNVPAEAAGGLAEKAGEIRKLLTVTPVHVDFTDLNRAGFERHLGPDRAAQKLWNILPSHVEPWGIGSTTASKLWLVNDRTSYQSTILILGRRMDLANSVLQWERWFQVFQYDPGLAERLGRIGAAVSAPHISRLRIMDVALWRYAKEGHPAPVLQ